MVVRPRFSAAMIFHPSRRAIDSHRSPFALFSAGLLCAWIAHAELRAAAPHSAISFDQHVKPLLETYCYECHGNGAHKGDVALDTLQTAGDLPADRQTWEAVLDYVRTREMPPEDAAVHPSDLERDTVTTWI